MATDSSQWPQWLQTICVQACGLGWKRAILLGEDLRDGPYTLRACLAQSGIMVFVPSEQDRIWLLELAEEVRYAGEAGDTALARLSALLADGMEHGVSALVATDATLAQLAHRAQPGLAVLDVAKDGA